MPWGVLGVEGEVAVVWATVAVLLLVTGRPLAAWLVSRPRLVERLGLAALLAAPVLTLALDLAAWRQFAPLGYRLPAPMVPLEAATLVALALWVGRGRPAGAGVAVAGLSVVAHRVSATLLFPLDGRRSDMLTSIAHGYTLLAQGASPFAQVPDRTAGAATWGVMPYLPGTFLAHAPAALLGLDLRWTGTVALAVLALLAAREARRRGARDAELLAAVVLLSPYHAYRHDLYFEPFLALTGLLFLGAARGEAPRGRLAALAAFTGAAAASRQWAWVYGPFVLVAVATTGARRRFAGRLALASVAALLAAAAVAGPLVARDPAAFVRTLLLHVNAPGGELSLGAALGAQRLGLSRLLAPLQGLAAAALFLPAVAGAARGRLGAGEVLARGWAALAASVLLSPFLENYFHLTPAFAAAALALGAAPREDRRAAHRLPDREGERGPDPPGGGPEDPAPGRLPGFTAATRPARP